MRTHRIQKLKKLKANRYGRDFIVGDVHGCFSELQELLTDAEFDFDHDRLFSVGDLIDRGSDSIKCLSLLNEPYFYAVKGNHESMFCQMVKKDCTWLTIEQYWNNINGGAWSKDLFLHESTELNYWYERIIRLPFVIEVAGNKNSTPFWIVHAELSNKHGELSPLNLQSFLDNATTNDTSQLQWSRRFYKKGYHVDLKTQNSFPGPIYCGHTPVDNAPLSINGHINLDGGAGKLSDDGKIASTLVLFCHTTSEYFIKKM